MTTEPAETEETEVEAEVDKEELKRKPLTEWTEEEVEAAKEMTHNIPVSMLTGGRLQEHGQKSMSWDRIVNQVLDKAEAETGAGDDSD